MSADTINNESGYIVDVVGNVTSYVPTTILRSDDVTLLEAAKTAQASVAGYHDLLVGGDKVGGDSTSLADGTYKLNVSVDSGAVTEIDVVIAGGANTVSDLLTAIDSGLTGASLAASSSISGGNIRVTSDSTDNDSKVRLSAGDSADLVAALDAALTADDVSLGTPVDGNVKTYLQGQTISRIGVNAWTFLKDAVVSFDSKGPKALLDGAAGLADASGTYTQAELQAVIERLNAVVQVLNDERLV